MLITLCYMYLWIRFHKCYSLLIRNRLYTLNSKRSLSFIRSSRSSSVTVLATKVAQAPCQYSAEDDIFLQLGDKSVTVTELQACDDIIKWNLLSESAIVCNPQKDISFIIEADGHNGTCKTPNNELLQVLKWSDFCQPLACSPGQPFRAVARASVDDFGRLAVAFLEDRLQLDNGLAPSKIVPIVLNQAIFSEKIQCRVEPINVKSILFDHTRGVNGQPFYFHMLPHLQRPQCFKSDLLLTPYAKKKFEKIGLSGPTCFSQDQSPNFDDNFLGNHHHMENHGDSLHLSSCHECRELENSTILSVKCTSAEKVSHIPDEHSLCLDCAYKTSEDFEPNVKSNVCKSNGFEYSKLPNVVVYTNGSKERFQAVHRVLTECLNMEKYVIHCLLPQQALNEPWIENTRLLVLAEEEVLTPQLHTKFLNYLSHGGRILGLASSLCTAGISVENREQQPRQVRRLSFTQKDNTGLELNVLATGKVFVGDVQGQGNLELLGELKDHPHHQKQMVIIRVTHGERGGKAVLCQIHLESTAVFQNLPTEGFDDVKVNNALQHQVLADILTSLDLSCQHNQTPAQSRVYLLATSQEAKAKFLQCLHTQVNDNGLVMMSKASLRIVPNTELLDGAFLHDSSLSLFTDSPESQNWDQFCFDTYCNNLTTVLLGHTLLYAEVVSSTMDLVEGLNLHLPEDVGLIAIAAQQSHGRGRGRNLWLSPLGCAMFTLCVQINLSSRLGQKISFLQHLAALAIIEAVRTLPGYEDIDLRIKWPNDIYNSKLMKLGGVLVTSTVMGSTFHLLIGCGFNVSNSNPTVCINDLIQQYNSQYNCNLQPLSCAQLIARTVNCLEHLIDCFQRGGPEAVLPIYYKRWLHSGGLVHLWSENGPEAEVVGLDGNGFLQVYNMTQGLVSVEPDGNSFDMLKNLVVIKQH